MTQEGWVKAIKMAQNEPDMLEILAQYLSEIDEAKQMLRDKGYSVTGQSLLHTVKTLPDYDS